MTEKEVYSFYNEKVKILYSEIEARENTLPVELLFEIHSAFDHLKRFHIDGESEDHCAEKAFSHLKRGLLDAFKLKLKYHNKDYNKLLRMKADLHLIDNGTFWPSLLSKRKVIVDLAKEARMYEGKSDIEGAFDNWYKASALIDQFESEYFESPKIQWAKKLGFFHRFWKIIISIIIGIITGVIGSAIVQYLFPGLFRFLER
jgi:hypothetical protein